MCKQIILKYIPLRYQRQKVEILRETLTKPNMKCLQLNKLGKYKDHGFKNLHIVDLDGALTGETVNLDIIQDIVVNLILRLR